MEEIAVTAAEATGEVVVEAATKVLAKNFSEKILFSASSIGVLAIAGVTCWGIYSLVKNAKSEMVAVSVSAANSMHDVEKVVKSHLETSHNMAEGPDLPVDEKPATKKK